MNSVDTLVSKLKNDETVKRIIELEKFIDNNQELKELIIRRNDVSKLILNSKRAGLINAYNDYKNEYDMITEKIMSYPFVEEYLDLLNQFNNEVKLINEYLENKINKILEEK